MHSTSSHLTEPLLGRGAAGDAEGSAASWTVGTGELAAATVVGDDGKEFGARKLACSDSEDGGGGNELGSICGALATARDAGLPTGSEGGGWNELGSGSGCEIGDDGNAFAPAGGGPGGGGSGIEVGVVEEAAEGEGTGGGGSDPGKPSGSGELGGEDELGSLGGAVEIVDDGTGSVPTGGGGNIDGEGGEDGNEVVVSCLEVLS